MSYFRRFFIWICLPLLFSSCYNMHVEIGNADKYYYDNTASKESNLNICPLENIKIHCSILGGVERYDTDKNEFIGTVVEYEIRLKYSTGYERTVFQGTSRIDVDFNWNTFGLPPGLTRLSLWINDGGVWKEKDYVEIPIQASIAPVTLTLQPAPYNSSDNRIQSWTGTYQETEAQNHGRSPQAVIDRVVIGGSALFSPQDITHAHGLVGTVDGGNFTPTGNTAQPYPSGQWHVGPSQAQMYRAQTWSQHYWEKVGPLTLTIYYRCAP